MTFAQRYPHQSPAPSVAWPSTSLVPAASAASTISMMVPARNLVASGPSNDRRDAGRVQTLAPLGTAGASTARLLPPRSRSKSWPPMSANARSVPTAEAFVQARCSPRLLGTSRMPAAEFAEHAGLSACDQAWW